MTSTTDTCDSIDATKRQQYCSINPKKEINFLQTKNIYASRLTITNLSCKKSIMYRVRLNASGQYLVTPSAGLVHPKASKIIQIVFCSKTQIEHRYDDMFLIQTLPYDSDEFLDEPQIILREFAKIKGPGELDVQSFKLRVHFEINKEPKLKTHARAQSQGQSPNTKNLAFFQEIGSPARIQGLRGSSPIVNNMCPTKKSPRDYNFASYSDKPLILPEKIMCSSNFRQSILNRFNHINQSVGTPPHRDMMKIQKADSILVTKFTTEWLPTKSTQNSSSDQKMKLDPKSVYQKKFESLEKRFNQQQEFLMRIIQEKSSFLDEINKFKFAFTSETMTTNESQPDFTKTPIKEAPRYELWQLMTISIIFLILGSLVKDFKY